MNPTVSIIIPLFNQAGFTKLCLEYIELNSKNISYEIILVDNASSDETKLLLERLPKTVQIIRNADNLGFGKACNQGADIARGEFLLFLNNDTVPTPGWLEALLEPFNRIPDLGIVGPKLVYPDGTLQQAGTIFSNKKTPYHLYSGCLSNMVCANHERFFQAVTGACFLIKKTDFFAADKFDLRYINGLEDIHLCLLLGKLGKRILYNPKSCVIHFESRSDNRQSKMDNNRDLFLSIWQDSITQDDFEYLREDGMDLQIIMGEFHFIPMEESNSLAAAQLSEIESKFQIGQVERFQILSEKILAQFIYNPQVYRRIGELVQKLGHVDLAEKLKAEAYKYSLKIVVIIPVFNRMELTRDCLVSIAKQYPIDISPEVIVFDNHSTDETDAYLREAQDSYDWLKVIRSEKNLGFGAGCNKAAELSDADILVFLNNDTLVLPFWLNKMLETFSDSSVGLVGSKLIYPDGRIQHAGMVFTDDSMPTHIHHLTHHLDEQVNEAMEYPAVTGACIMIKSRLFMEVGGFDGDYPMYYEDVDLCFKVRSKGLKVVYQPKSVVVHYEGRSSSGQEAIIQYNQNSRKIFLQKWGEFILKGKRRESDFYRFGKPYFKGI